MEILTSIIVLSCIVGFEAISSLIWRPEYAGSKRNLLPYVNRPQNLLFILLKSNGSTIILNSKSSNSIINKNRELELIVRKIVRNYLASNVLYYRSDDPRQGKDVKQCEENCYRDIRRICKFKQYHCTDYTITHLSHSCYSECHWHLEDPNPYREKLFHEKFRKRVTTTTTTEIPHAPTTRKTKTTKGVDYYEPDVNNENIDENIDENINENVDQNGYENIDPNGYENVDDNFDETIDDNNFEENTDQNTDYDQNYEENIDSSEINYSNTEYLATAEETDFQDM